MSNTNIQSLDEFSPQQRGQIRGTIVEVLSTLPRSQRERPLSFNDNADFLYDPSPCRLDPCRTDEICYSLHRTAVQPLARLQAVDNITAKLFEHWFVPWGSWVPSEEVLANSAYNLILRMPSQALSLHTEHHNEAAGVQDDHNGFDYYPRAETEGFIDQNVARMALRVCILLDRPRQAGRQGEPYWAMAQVTEDIALLLDAAERISTKSKFMTQENREGWVFVKSFLWRSLQRLFMLWTWSVATLTTRDGYEFGLVVKHRSQQERIRPIVLSQISLHNEDILKMRPESLCPWAFQLLRNDGFSLCVDIRRPLASYATIFGDRPPRCRTNPQDQRVCDGTSFEKCGRFVGAKVIRQSSHECSSKDCSKLFWDEDSYCAFQTPVVSTYHTTSARLKYTELSDKTLSISHVWSHGQGGRPETGFNTCLHDRYVKVAKALGCDSYWMDTPCIPTETSLRKKAIANINHIFMNSKATLVCDRDLMEIDISLLKNEIATSATVRLSEAVLIALLVCDWNVRGWTFLEAIRGKQALYLLCKNSEVCALSELLRCVSTHGSLELANLFLAAAHLLPLPQELVASHKANRYGNSLMFFDSIEEAGTVLSRRPASRPDDNLVIWSLLFFDAGYNFNLQESDLDRNNPEASRGVRDAAHHSAKEMWKSQYSVCTSYLVSSAPRIPGTRGLGWAPCSPVPDEVDVSQGLRRYYPYEDIGGEVTRGYIRHSGLVAEWLTCLFLGEIGLGVSSETPLGSQFDIGDNSHQQLEDTEDWYHPLDPLDILSRPFNTTKDDQRLRGIYQLSAVARFRLMLENIRLSWISNATLIELHKISAAYLSGFRWGILLRPSAVPWHHSKYLDPYPLVYEANPKAPLIVVCGSNDGCQWVYSI
ncbi:hypothetical protein G7Y89_g8867 [Cudoniella acicularis]|uniref:Heterokaryon incompatibility domain-containing protein n=1 Tax=Cudoniella acicularis TaxID=354080 RepID=A0A8H4RHE1_9HELO|nr:hypothetical protein G7Y89_g8867 [Cudoniella acicularis]